MRYLFLILTFGFSAQLEVEGNLSVNGTVNANGNPVTNVGVPTSLNDAINGNVLQDALRDNGNYEYKIIYLKLDLHNYSNNVSIHPYSKWLELNQIIEGQNLNSIDSFTDEINTLFNDSWELHSINGENSSWWIFKRPIEE